MPAAADQLSVFPVFLKVEGRTAVVVGDGEEALAKARLLKESRIAVRLVAPLPSRALGAFVIQADLDHVAAPFAPSMLDGAVMVFAATGDAEADARVVAAARSRAIPANAVDRPQLCDFYTPALVNRAPVAVAIGSEGAGPVLTQIIRARIEALLPRSTGPLARLAAGYRRVVERLVARGAPRRRFWHAFFEGEVARCLDEGRPADARREATRLLKAQAASSARVSLIGAGPGAGDLLTLRGQRALLMADVIIHDPRVGKAIVGLGRRDARRFSADLSQAVDRAIATVRAGRQVALLVPGDGASLDAPAAALTAAGIGFETVPGVAAATTGSRSNPALAAA